MLGGEKRGRARSSTIPSDTLPINAMRGWKVHAFKKHAHKHIHSRFSFPFFSLSLSLLSFLSSLFFTFFILDDEERKRDGWLRWLAMMDTCSSAVRPLELRRIVVERGRREPATIRLREAAGVEGKKYREG